MGILCCIVVEGDTRNPFFASLGLAAALGFAFFSLHTNYNVVVGGKPYKTPFSAALGLAWPLRLAFLCTSAYCVVS